MAKAKKTAKQVYRTKDLPVAAFLLVAKENLVKIEKDPKENFYWFVFENDKCLETVDKYWAYGGCKAREYEEKRQWLWERVKAGRWKNLPEVGVEGKPE